MLEIIGLLIIAILAQRIASRIQKMRQLEREERARVERIKRTLNDYNIAFTGKSVEWED